MPYERVERPAETAQPVAPGLSERVVQIARDARRLAYDHLELAALDAQRAAESVVRLLCAAIVVSVLVVAAWVALVASAAIWATRSGLSLQAALALAGVANLVAAGIAVAWARMQVPDTIFAASLRQLRESAGGDDEEDSAS